jgi:hypothetical protein
MFSYQAPKGVQLTHEQKQCRFRFTLNPATSTSFSKRRKKLKFPKSSDCQLKIGIAVQQLRPTTIGAEDAACIAEIHAGHTLQIKISLKAAGNDELPGCESRRNSNILLLPMSSFWADACRYADKKPLQVLLDSAHGSCGVTVTRRDRQALKFICSSM